MFWAELIVVLGMIMIGARFGGIFLGMSSGAAVAILVFGFGCVPGSPAIDVIMIIMTVVVIAAVLQASGGMDYLIQIAVKLLRANPERISYYAPLISWVFTFMCGTGNIVFGIQAITACPISAATVALLGMLAPAGITLIDILIVCIPSTLIGVICGCLWSARVGKDLNVDEEYLERVKNGTAAPINEKANIKDNLPIKDEAKRAVWLYLLATVIVVAFGIFPSLRPTYMIGEDPVTLSMTMTIEIVMMIMAGVIIMTCKVNVASVLEQSVYKNGLIHAARYDRHVPVRQRIFPRARLSDDPRGHCLRPSSPTCSFDCRQKNRGLSTVAARFFILERLNSLQQGFDGGDFCFDVRRRHAHQLIVLLFFVAQFLFDCRKTIVAIRIESRRRLTSIIFYLLLQLSTQLIAVIIRPIDAPIGKRLTFRLATQLLFVLVHLSEQFRFIDVETFEPRPIFLLPALEQSRVLLPTKRLGLFAFDLLRQLPFHVLKFVAIHLIFFEARRRVELLAKLLAPMLCRQIIEHRYRRRFFHSRQRTRCSLKCSRHLCRPLCRFICLCNFADVRHHFAFAQARHDSLAVLAALCKRLPDLAEHSDFLRRLQHRRLRN